MGSVGLIELLMLKGRITSTLPTLNLTKLTSKIALGTVCLIFLLDYQPTFNFPPIKRSIAIAQSEQTASIDAKVLPGPFQLPHPGYKSTSYSTYHQGIDIATGLGMPIKPVAAGKVVEAGFNFWGLGLIVVIDHGQGYKSLYAHMGKIYVKKDQDVTNENLIGEVGMTGHTTGPHTHLELSKDGTRFDPMTLLPTIAEYPYKNYNATTSGRVAKR